MMKLVDISDLGSDELVRGGSSPSIRIMKEKFFCKTFSLFENVSQNFVLNGIDTLGCAATDTVFVKVVSGANAIVSEDIIYCKGGQPVPLSAGGGDTYKWFPSSGLNVNNNSSVLANPLNTTTYGVAVASEGINCPPDTAYIKVTVANPPVADAGPDLFGNYGAVLDLNGSCIGCVAGATL